jgi:hypothetical protein
MGSISDYVVRHAAGRGGDIRRAGRAAGDVFAREPKSWQVGQTGWLNRTRRAMTPATITSGQLKMISPKVAPPLRKVA